MRASRKSLNLLSCSQIRQVRLVLLSLTLHVRYVRSTMHIFFFDEIGIISVAEKVMVIGFKRQQRNYFFFQLQVWQINNLFFPPTQVINDFEPDVEASRLEPCQKTAEDKTAEKVDVRLRPLLLGSSLIGISVSCFAFIFPSLSLETTAQLTSCLYTTASLSAIPVTMHQRKADVLMAVLTFLALHLGFTQNGHLSHLLPAYLAFGPALAALEMGLFKAMFAPSCNGHQKTESKRIRRFLTAYRGFGQIGAGALILTILAATNSNGDALNGLSNATINSEVSGPLSNHQIETGRQDIFLPLSPQPILVAGQLLPAAALTSHKSSSDEHLTSRASLPDSLVFHESSLEAQQRGEERLKHQKNSFNETEKMDLKTAAAAAVPSPWGLAITKPQWNTLLGSLIIVSAAAIVMLLTSDVVAVDDAKGRYSKPKLTTVTQTMSSKQKLQLLTSSKGFVAAATPSKAHLLVMPMAYVNGLLNAYLSQEVLTVSLLSLLVKQKTIEMKKALQTKCLQTNTLKTNSTL